MRRLRRDAAEYAAEYLDTLAEALDKVFGAAEVIQDALDNDADLSEEELEQVYADLGWLERELTYME